MTSHDAADSPARPIRGLLVACLLALGAAIPAVVAYQVPAVSSSAPPTSSPSATPAASAPVAPRAPRQGPIGAADGVIPAGTTVFDEGIPGVANLDPALLAALRRAARDAADDGIELLVNSGWRSAAYQEQLLRGAVAKYGSEREAARWVGTPETSAHVSGDAVDLGPSAATTWLARHGAAYGLCPIYRNEPWHFELRPAAAERGCPPMYADAAHDPRMEP